MELRAFDERVGRASWRGFCWGAGLGTAVGACANDLIPDPPQFAARAPEAIDWMVACSGVALSKLSLIALCAWGGACLVGCWVRFVRPQTRRFD